MAKPNAAFTFQSYAMDGIKESFANWVSNLSPTDTPFISMTGKEAVANSLYQWQTDSLARANPLNHVSEGSRADDVTLTGTTVIKSNTQILRKVVKVSDTANALANYGRGQELQYQMEKAGKEIKRDLEAMFLQNVGPRSAGTQAGTASTPANPSGTVGSANAPRFDTYISLCSGVAEPDRDTGEAPHIQTILLNESDIWRVTEALYTLGADTDVIMFHPKHAKFFSRMMEQATGFQTGVIAEGNASRIRMFKNVDTKVNTYVSTIVDPLGQEYKLLPNRFAHPDKIYVFSSNNWTQMVLRAPERKQLAKDGSYEKWMIEMEVGLRHRNPFASGLIEIGSPLVGKVADGTGKAAATNNTIPFASLFDIAQDATGAPQVAATDYDFTIVAAPGEAAAAPGATVSTAGVVTVTAATAGHIVYVKATPKASGAANGKPVAFASVYPVTTP